MTDYLKVDREFKEALGAFMIGFSELEYGLVILCTLTEFDLRKKDSSYLKYLGMGFEQKKKVISEYVDLELTELKGIWSKIEKEIDFVNRERRYLVHGIHQYFLPTSHIATRVKVNGKLDEKKFTVSDVKILTSKVSHLNTGSNGINGEFYVLFVTKRVNLWNSLVNDEAKIVYKVNDKIVSDWKGR